MVIPVWPNVFIRITMESIEKFGDSVTIFFQFGRISYVRSELIIPLIV